mmetsp:Transcript_55174/g.101287  ORF Transcript_55174/g.101287 Transcript_55174/m.101287 type:complete len:147 (-) Transcript_55174:29-469(-)
MQLLKLLVVEPKLRSLLLLLLLLKLRSPLLLLLLRVKTRHCAEPKLRNLLLLPNLFRRQRRFQAPALVPEAPPAQALEEAPAPQEVKPVAPEAPPAPAVEEVLMRVVCSLAALRIQHLLLPRESPPAKTPQVSSRPKAPELICLYM